MPKFDLILIVEDTPNLREDLKNIIELNSSNRKIVTAQNEIKALKMIQYNDFDVVVTDIKLDEAGGSETGGLDVLKAALKKNKNTNVIVVTAFGKKEIRDENADDLNRITIEEKVRKMGAFHYIQRPNPNGNYLEEVRRFVDLALKSRNA